MERRGRRRAGGKRPPKRERKAGGGAASGDDVVAPLQGSIFKVEVAEGDEVEEGALIVVIEAMKMENEITAHKAGKVASLAVEVGSKARTEPGDKTSPLLRANACRAKMQ